MALLSRKHFVAASAAFSALAIPRYANAAEFTYKMATDKDPGHPTAIRLLEAAKTISRESNGRLEIQVYLNNALGGQEYMPGMLRSGAVELICSGDFIFEATVPVVGITGLPFIVSTQKSALALLDGPLGAYIRTALEKVDVYTFGHSWDNGFRQTITGAKQIHVPDDLKGLKIRTPPAPVTTALFRSFGASPTAISSNEMYVALQTHLVDGLEVPLSTLEVYKLYDVQKYVAYTNHIWTAFTVYANGLAWKRLPNNLREIAERNINAAGNLNNADFVTLMAGLESKLQGQGMTFNAAAVDAFRDVVRQSGLYTTWKEHYGAAAWALLEKSVGRLT